MNFRAPAVAYWTEIQSSEITRAEGKFPPQVSQQSHQ